VARAADAPKPPLYSLDFFQKSASAVIGHDDLVELPDLPDAMVFQPEPEFAFVIGKQARNVPEAQALDYVFGYMNFSDISARGMPNRRTQFISKGQHSWAPMGPVIVTKDEIPDPQDVRVRLWLNGEQKQDYKTSLMVHPVSAQIAWLSPLVTLQPGDVVSTGTHHLGLSPINEGDVVEIEGDGLERLRFRIKSYGPVKTETWIPGPPQARPQH
jgi:2-keto-4-pentenoate hydratase/2-oxohepta-3-ene-1,7-dioic acid hydratase in catechol pathway